jgi:predicted flap endonuclease-1-like 5' DNA nuclease
VCESQGAPVIFLSLVLVIVAAVALVLGLFQDGLVLIYVSMATTLAAMLVLAVAAVLQRRQGAAAGPASYDSGTTASSAAVARTPVAPLGRPERDTERRDAEDRDAEDRDAEDRDAEERDGDPGEGADDAGTGSTAVDRPARKRAVVKRTRVAPSPGPAQVDHPTDGRPAAKKAAVAKRTTVAEATPTGSPAVSGAGDLTTVRGLGPAKRERLLERFGSVEAIAAATVEDLTEVPGIGVGTARAIKDALG